MPVHEAFLGLASLGLDLELLTLEMESDRAMRVFTDQAASRGGRISRAARNAGIKKFSRYWIGRRLSVSLQVRLFVEAVLFSMDKPWSDLVSGFRPLRMYLK